MFGWIAGSNVLTGCLFVLKAGTAALLVILNLKPSYMIFTLYFQSMGAN